MLKVAALAPAAKAARTRKRADGAARDAIDDDAACCLCA
jgi:hypothetical protein